MPKPASEPPLSLVLNAVLTAAVDGTERIDLFQARLDRRTATAEDPADATGPAPERRSEATVLALPRPRAPHDEPPPAA